MNKADKLIKECMNTNNKTDEFWIKAYNEMKEIIKKSPQKEKDKLLNLGIGEMILMIYDGLNYEKRIEKKNYND